MKEKQTILIADDSEMNRAILAEMLGDSYVILEAENGCKAIESMQCRADIDLVLLDIMMPEMDGFDVLKVMNQQNWIAEVPVIMISAESSLDSVERAYDLGASDYISRPFDMAVVRRRVVNTLLLYAKQKRLVRLVADQVYEKERNNRLMINILSHLVEFRNGESGLHVLHINRITDLLLHRLVRKTSRYRLTPERIAQISTASALHDIGKINIPESILNKPGRLTAEEFEIMKTHTTIGAGILEELVQKQEWDLLDTAYSICRWHHERYDGRGYPDGLQGDEIPIAAQVVSLADVYDALTSERCYKKAFDHETAMGMILRGECGVFNPLLLECLQEAEAELQSEMKPREEECRSLSEAVQLSERLLTRDKITRQDHMLHVLRTEQKKTEFFRGLQRQIQFDYDALAHTLRLSEWAAEHTRGELSVYMPAVGGSFLDEADEARLRAAILSTTPEKPDVSITAMIAIDGVYRWHRIEARSLWTSGDPPQYVGAVGQAEDIHDQMVQRFVAPKEFTRSTGAEMQSAMQCLRQVFSVVRLVDVKNARVLEAVPDGRSAREECPCYSIWDRSARCVNCTSARALESRSQLSKLEVGRGGMYQVISKYVEVDGKPCVLEIVNHLQGVPSPSGEELFATHLTLPEDSRGGGGELYQDALTGAYNRILF